MSERINLTPAVWGPKTWFFLESMAMAYSDNPTDDEKLSAKNLIMSLKDLLPCWSCRNNYNNYITDYFKVASIDDVVSTRSKLVTFINDVHNDVRVRNKQNSRTIEEVFKYYNQEYMAYSVKNTVQENFSSKNENKINYSQTESYKLVKSLLYQFNPLMILIGIILGLIIYKLYQDMIKYDQ